MNPLARTFAPISLLAALILVGCNKESPASSGAAPDAPTGGQETGHDDHDHEHGAERPLGTVELAGAEFAVSVSGELKPGGELHVDITRTGGTAPAALRLWIGDEAGTGAIKSKADGHDDHYHAHAEAPATLGESAALWLEAESADGSRTKASLALTGAPR